MEMEKKKIKKLIKEVKKNKNPALMLNRVLTEEEIKWLYDHADRPKHEVGWFREDGRMLYYGPDGERY